MRSSTAEAIGHADISSVEIRCAYQPIVDLASREVVAFEALARGPVGSPLAMPDALFHAARERGVVRELDQACRAAAVNGALDARLARSVRLFVNVEPAALGPGFPAELAALSAAGGGRMRPVMEVTERALMRDPAGLLVAVDAARRAGWGVALDDVGAEPASLALMPFLQPDVVKLDMRLVRDRTSSETARIVNAVIAHAERTGAAVLAEGIETELHHQRARALGATLGQGWLFGRPGDLPASVAEPSAPLAPVSAPAFEHLSPFSLVRDRADVRTATKGLLLPLSHHLERHALGTGEPPVLLATFEHVDHFTPATRARYATLARRCAFVAALGAGMPAAPVDGVRGASFAGGDALRGEWVVACVGPHFAGALIARDLGDRCDDRDRRFEFTITYDRDTVIRASRALLARVVAV